MSSTLDCGMLSVILKEILRTSSALTYGSSVLPSMDPTSRWPQVSARKASSLKQWFMERHNFEEMITSQYATLPKGETRLLVAGTGVGKTTRLPYCIAKNHNVSGLVLMPKYDLMLDVHAYMSKCPEYTAVNFERLRLSIIDKPPTGNTVYFCTAPDFLAMYNRIPSLCELLRIDFMFLDEQHVPRPDYTFISYMADNGMFPKTRVFYGTATAAGASDMNMEGGVKRVVVKKPPALFPSDPRQVSQACPMFEGNITDRTLAFVCDDIEIKLWKAYYEQYDIPVISYGYADMDSRLPEVRTFFIANPLGICLSCDKLETSVTLDIDTVIDCGRTMRLRYDVLSMSSSIERIPVTLAQQIQRRGRVARFKPGRAIYSDVTVSQPVDLMCMEQSIYIFLWAKKFNMRVRHPQVAEWENAFGDLSQVAASALLVSRLPPLLLFPYTSDNGLFDAWKHLQSVFYVPNIPIVAESCADRVEKWQTLSTGPQPYMQGTDEFMTKITPPLEWYPMFHWAYSGFVESDSARMVNFDSQSYAATVVQKSVPVRQESAVTKRKPSVARTTVGSRVREARQMFDAQSAFYSTGEPFKMFSGKRNYGEPALSVALEAYEDDVEEIPRQPPHKAKEVESWVASSAHSVVQKPRDISLHTTGPSRGQYHKRSRSDQIITAYSDSSDTSGEKNELFLKKVDPMKYMYEKLYPADNAIRGKFLDRQNCEERDRDRLRDLLTNRKNFSSLERAFENRKDTQTTYFLSILRMHNKYVMELAQMAASSVRPSFFDKKSELKTTDKVIETAKLLRMCEMENYFVAVDQRIKHSGNTPLSATQFRLRSFSMEQAKATFSMTIGDPVVKEKVDALVDSCVPVFLTDEREDEYLKCHVWLNGESIFTATHAFVDEEDKVVKPIHASAVKRRSGELLEFEAVAKHSNQVNTACMKQGMELFVLAAESVTSRDVRAHGPYALYKMGAEWHIDGDFIFGYSGALCVDASTGIPVGIYVGSFLEIEGKYHGTVVSF